MNKTIPGILLFKKPNQYTVQSPTSPGLYVIPYQCEIDGVSRDEYFAVGTRCGTAPFNQERVDDYTAYKQGLLPIKDIVLMNNPNLDLKDFQLNWKKYHENQFKEWFGEDFIVF